jgi:hypothetical protein
MYAVLRTYSGTGADGVFAMLEEREAEVRELIGGVPGFVSYAAVRNGDGGVTMTLCDDKAGAEESSTRAAAFVKEHLDQPPAAPSITEGDTVIQFSA